MNRPVRLVTFGTRVRNPASRRRSLVIPWAHENEPTDAPEEFPMPDLVLPSFEMDCRDWIVVTPDDAGLPDEVAGTPLLAMLSTVVLGESSFAPASGLLTVGLVDDQTPHGRPVPGGDVAAELVDPEAADFGMRFVLPAPDGRLAVLAEFAMPEGRDPEVVERVEDLMRSFRWAA